MNETETRKFYFIILISFQECVRRCMEQIEMLMHASLPPSPTSSPTHLRLGGGNNGSNLRMHRGGPTSSSTVQQEHFSVETSIEHQHHILDDAINSSLSVQQDKEEIMRPSTPEGTLRSMTSFSSPFSDDSTPTKVLDVARKNC